MFHRAFTVRGDRGQALPIYITVIGALLFLAFAYFAVGQAAATRNGAQTAADSAALAATQDRGAQIRAELLRVFQSGGLGGVGRLLDGRFPALLNSCGRAGQFAQDNKAHVTDCRPVAGGYHVRVVTDYTVGKSVLPGTERKHGAAQATAVMTPLCRWTANPAAPSSGPPPAGPTSTPRPSPSAASPGTLVCRGGTWPVDPGNLTAFPSLADLFSVHLTS
jgi:hypothetical protein